MTARRRDGISTPKLLLFDIRVAVVLSLGRCCYELNKEKDERQKDSLCCSHYVTNEDRGRNMLTTLKIHSVDAPGVLHVGRKNEMPDSLLLA